MYVCMYVVINVFVHMYVYVCMYIYIHIHTCSTVVKVRMNENAIMYECIYVCMYCSGETMYEC